MTATGIAAVTWLAVAAGLADPLRAEWRRSIGDPGQACFDFERASVAALATDRVGAYSVISSDASLVSIRYATSGADGVPSEVEAVCALRAGVVSGEDTLRRREHDQGAKRLDRLMTEFDCLERKKKLVAAGQSEQARRVQCPR